MGFDPGRGPLRVDPWMLREIAMATGGNSPHARMVREDLAFIGAAGIADMASVKDDDPAWNEPMDAFVRLLTDRSPAATARIGRHVLRVADMDGSSYGDIMVDPVIAHVAATLGNSVAGLVMMTRIHEDQALNWRDGGDDTVAINLEDVEHEGGILPFLTIGFEIAPGIQLEAGRFEVLSHVPDTIASALPVMRLAEFISHPLLDPFEVRIRSFDGTALHLDYDGMATTVFHRSSHQGLIDESSCNRGNA
jgi:hypothetical protein